MKSPLEELPIEEITDLCLRWRIRELAVFGSILTEHFRPDSDIDLLAAFQEDAPWSLLDIVRLEEELEAVLGRPVDLFTRHAVEQCPNALLKNEILNSARRVYAA